MSLLLILNDYLPTIYHYLWINPFQPRVAFHIETNRLFCIAKQMTGFYMKGNTGLIWVNYSIPSPNVKKTVWTKNSFHDISQFLNSFIISNKPDWFLIITSEKTIRLSHTKILKDRFSKSCLPQLYNDIFLELAKTSYKRLLKALK